MSRVLLLTDGFNERHNTQRFIPRTACHLKNIRSPGKEVKTGYGSTTDATTKTPPILASRFIDVY
ncbi:MAG: hypothetical protein H8D45_07960 [Bacteroidetes bacterium]|nr:hypothetical protein [Bacteroidota bacterium]